MALVSIVFGVLLILVGVVPYLMHPVSKTALIPAAVGVLLAILGAAALNRGARKHAMHAAAMVGALGFLAAIGRLVSSLVAGRTPTALAGTSIVLMAILCGLFVILCVRSFIKARRQRLAGFEPVVSSNRA